MKKFIYTLLLSFVLGGVMAYVTYKKVHVYIPKTDTFTVYQVGVYNEYSNALNKALQLKGSIIVPKNDTYQVIAAVGKDSVALNKIEEMLNKENVNFYRKEISLDKEYSEVINDYEVIIKETNDMDTLELINQKLLQTLQERMK